MNSVKKFIEAVGYVHGEPQFGNAGRKVGVLTCDVPEGAKLYAAPVAAAPVCLACEGRPSGTNIPCAVCNSTPAAPCIDASHSGALPTLPDDFSESKDWRAGSYGERVEWLMDTVRSQREHIAALLDNH